MHDVAIIGGGISGLTCGYYLKRAGLDVAIVDSGQVGGAMRTQRIGSYLLESGPNSLRGNSPELAQLIINLGLLDQVVKSSPQAKKRYLYRDGKLLAAPSSPFSAITTSLIPIREKLKLLREPFADSVKLSDESIKDFVSRRVSPWFAENIIDPVMTGIFAGAISNLSARSVFPKMWENEQTHGSVIGGMIRGKRSGEKKRSSIRGIFTFKDGLGSLVHALHDELKDSVTENCAVTALHKLDDGYHLVGPNITARKVILACPSYSAADLIREYDIKLSSSLRQIEYPHVAVVTLAYKRSHILHPLDGFGYLVPSNQGRAILGCIFTSSLWNDRAPADEALLTVMLGGSAHPEMKDLPDDRIIGIARREIGSIVQTVYVPQFNHVTRWPKAIPQYHTGHYKIIESIEAFESKNPSIHILSNYRGGIAIGACVTNATELARRLVQEHNL